MTVAPMTGSPRESVTFPRTVTFWAKASAPETINRPARKRQRIVLKTFIKLELLDVWSLVFLVLVLLVFAKLIIFAVGIVDKK